TRGEEQRQDHRIRKYAEALEGSHLVRDRDAERGEAEGEEEDQAYGGDDTADREFDIDEAGEEKDDTAMQRRDRGAAQHLAEDEDEARHRRDEDLPKEAEFAVPDHG